MRVVVVSGIWPPDVGGPAIHAPALAGFLVRRGHAVEVVTTADGPPGARSYPISWTSRSLPRGVRHAAATRLVARAARRADVVYATSMVRRAAGGASLARSPLVAKLVADEAYERARRAGRFTGTLEEFQGFRGDARIRALRRSRDAALRRAVRVITPSAYLRAIALGWGLPPERVTVVPNPAPEIAGLAGRDEAREELGVDGSVLAFAGRLTRQKALDGAIEVVARLPDVTLLVLGDGPEREPLRQLAVDRGVAGRIRFLGGGTRDDVLRLFRAADAAILPSSWENFPHTVVEALAVGTPVVATAVGGVPEIVVDGVNGLLVPPGDLEALTGAIDRVMRDRALRERLAAAAAASVEPLREEALLEQIEAILLEVVG